MDAALGPLEDAQQAPPTRLCRFCDAPLPAYSCTAPAVEHPFERAVVLMVEGNLKIDAREMSDARS